MQYRESELGARRSNSCLVFVCQLECLNGNGPLRLFTGGTNRRSERLRVRSPTLSHRFTPSTHVRKQSLPVWHDEFERATRPCHTRTGTCSAVAESSETGLELTTGGVVSLTIRRSTKSSERCDVDHIGMSGNLCKTTTPGANESDFCRQVWSQCKQMNILALKVAWAGAGASRNRTESNALVNIIPTRNPQRTGMQRLPGDRSRTVSRSAKRGL